MYEEHGCGLYIEREFGGKCGTVVVASALVGVLESVGECIGGIDTYSPLYITGNLVDVVDGPVCSVERRCYAHQGQVATGRATHDTYAVGVEATRFSLFSYYFYGALQILPCGCVLSKAVCGAR